MILLLPCAIQSVPLLQSNAILSETLDKDSSQEYVLESVSVHWPPWRRRCCGGVLPVVFDILFTPCTLGFCDDVPVAVVWGVLRNLDERKTYHAWIIPGMYPRKHRRMLIARSAEHPTSVFVLVSRLKVYCFFSVAYWRTQKRVARIWSELVFISLDKGSLVDCNVHCQKI